MHYGSLAKRVGNVVRLAEVIRVLVRHGFADLVRRLGLHEGIPATVLRGLRLLETPSGGPETVGARLRDALTELGPTFVKFGQILSTRPDLVGKEIADDLGGLQDHVAAGPFEELRPALEKAVGGPIEDAFAEFSRTPVASASLSQVYKARLKSGEAVAVKIQRPGVAHIIRSDLSLLRGVAEWIAEHVDDLEWMDPVGTVNEFERSILRELDFSIEARVINRFHKNFEGVSSLFVPGTYPELCSNHVLTMDWIEGVRVDAVDAYPELGSDPHVVAALGCDILCRQVFEHRLFHADPHPGNILLTRFNQVAFLDYGMVGHLEQTDVFAIADLLRAILDEDPDACMKAALVFTTAGDTEDRDTLTHELAEYLAFEASSVVAGGQVRKAIEQVTAILRRHRLQLSPRFSLLLKALATIETTGRQLDPDLDMIPILRPHIESLIRKRYEPAHLAREARHHLSDLLRMTRDFPGDARQLLRMLKLGRLKMQLNHEGLDRLASVTDRASNRITFGLITGAIIVGSSLLITMSDRARTLGLIGYIFAAVLGSALVISIIRSRNY